MAWSHKSETTTIEITEGKKVRKKEAYSAGLALQKLELCRSTKLQILHSFDSVFWWAHWFNLHSWICTFYRNTTRMYVTRCPKKHLQQNWDRCCQSFKPPPAVAHTPRSAQKFPWSRSPAQQSSSEHSLKIARFQEQCDVRFSKKPPCEVDRTQPTASWAPNMTLWAP